MTDPTPIQIVALAREAEAHDREAIAEMDSAQLPESDGGSLITPREATRIRMRVLKSALLDHEAASLAEPGQELADPEASRNAPSCAGELSTPTVTPSPEVKSFASLQ